MAEQLQRQRTEFLCPSQNSSEISTLTLSSRNAEARSHDGRSQPSRSTEGQRSSAPTPSIGHNEFLMVFDTGSGSNKVAYFLIDNTGNHKKILPKQNTMSMTKINDITCYCVLVMDNYVYVLGGKHLLGYVLSYCYRFNPQNNQWCPLANMNTARCRHTATVLNGCIYVTGGETRTGTFTDRVERFDPRTDTWTELRSMPSQRADHAAVSAQGKLFITGGVGNRTGSSVNFWQYEPDTDFWTQAQRRSMLTRPKERHSMIHHRNRLYCLGGVTMDRFGDDVEDDTLTSFDCSKYNVGPRLEGLWDRSHADQTRPRCRGDCVLIGHYIYNIGGHNYSAGRPEHVVEYFNIHRRRWQQGFRLVGEGYSSVQCCIVRVPTTNKQFNTLGLVMNNRWIMW